MRATWVWAMGGTMMLVGMGAAVAGGSLHMDLRAGQREIPMAAAAAARLQAGAIAAAMAADAGDAPDGALESFRHAWRRTEPALTHSGLRDEAIHATASVERWIDARARDTDPNAATVARARAVDALELLVKAAARRDAEHHHETARIHSLAQTFALLAWIIFALASLVAALSFRRLVWLPLRRLASAGDAYQHTGAAPRTIDVVDGAPVMHTLTTSWNKLVGEYLVSDATHAADAEALTSLARQVQILNHTKLAILAFRRDGTLVSANAGACMLLRRRRDELMGRRLRDLVSEPHQARVDDWMRDLELLGTLARTTCELVGHDAEVIPVEVSGARVTGTEGEDDSYFVVVEDVTEMRKLQDRLVHMIDDLEAQVAERTRELSRERDKVAAFLEQAPDMMCEVDAQGRVTYANPAFERQLGIPVPDVVGGALTSLLAPEARAATDAMLARLAEQSPRVQRLELLSRQGARVPVEAALTLVRDKEGQTAGARIVARSLAERTESERRQQLLLAAMEGTQDGIIITDLDGRIMQVNAAAAALCGTTAAELVGRLQYELAGPTPESQATERKMLREVLTQRACSAESARWPGGSHAVPVACTCTVIPDASGQDLAIVTIQRDLTEERSRHEREQAFRDSLVRSDKLSALGEMIAGVAHELNNPLGAVIGYAQLLAMTEVSEQSQEDCTKLVQVAERCRRIVHNLLTFARKHKPERRPGNLNQVVKDAVSLLEYEFNVTNIAIELDLDPSVPLLSIDAHQLQQVLVNLLKNSEQAIHDIRPSGTIRIGTRAQDGEVMLTFQDDGPGIPSDIRTKVFDPFFTTKEVGKGTGLGLSITFGIIKEHGGNIRIENGALPGACFVLTLPVQTGELTPLPEAVPAEHAADVQGRRILVVDDEAPIRDVVRRVLGKGNVVDVATNTAEALELLAVTPYDCILCDEHMPGGRGTELLDRATSVVPEIHNRAILITGDTIDPQTQAWAERTGVRFCPKPFDLADLLSSVRAVLADDAGVAQRAA